MNPASLNRRLASCVAGMLLSSGVLAAGQVSSILVSEQSATPFTYAIDGTEFNWGRGNNQLLEGFSVDGRTYGYINSANEVIVRRDDINDIATGEPCGIFVERRLSGERDYAADFPLDSSAGGNCSLESLLGSRIVNRGVVDVFSNKRPDAKNIERLDYMFYYGALAPFTEDNLRFGGHVVAEKRGNNPVKIAAIMSLDVFGQPDEYGPLVLISEAGCSGDELCYGATDLVHDYAFLQNEFDAPQGLPVETERSREVVNMAFVSTAALGLSPGQRYFGVSIFADDVDSSLHNLIDPRTFPDNTSDDHIVVGDDADIYGGLNGYFLGDEVNVARGSLFLDVDLDGVHGAGEAGISDVTVTLYSDVNGDGMITPGVDTPLGDTLLSDSDGSFVFPGLPDGNYLVVIDNADPEIPAGLTVAPGINPHALTIGGGDSEPVNFAFVSESGTGSGSDSDDPGDGSGGDSGDGSGGDSGDGSGGDSGDGSGGDSGDGSGGDSGDGSGGDSGDGSGGDSGDGSGGDSGDGSGGDSGDGSGGDSGDGSGGDSGDGSGGDSGDGSGGDSGDGSGGDSGDGSGGDSGDGSGGDSGDGSGDDGSGGQLDDPTDGTGDGSGGDTGDGSGGDTGDGSGGDTVDGSGGGTGDGSGGDTGDGSGGDAGDGSGGDTGDGSGGDTGDGSGGDTGDGSGDTDVGSGGNTGDGTNNGENDSDGEPVADASTAANSDSFSINQGETGRFDVVDNDFDGTGNNDLTLVEVSGSANATITITDDNLVLYVPNPGYYSPEDQPDTFTYTMVDGDGTERSANVRVTVVRFSDLNRNGENDFVECDCTDLFLETGVNGSGIGHVSRWFVFALFLLGLWRLQNRLVPSRVSLKGGK